MGRRTKGAKGRYLVHAGRDFTKKVPGLFNDKNYKKGQIIDNVSIKRSLAMDRLKKSKRVSKSGYGHIGDLKYYPKKKKSGVTKRKVWKVVTKRRRDGIKQRYHIKR